MSWCLFQGLKAWECHGVCFRDLKPENVMVCKTTAQLKLIGKPFEGCIAVWMFLYFCLEREHLSERESIWQCEHAHVLCPSFLWVIYISFHSLIQFRLCWRNVHVSGCCKLASFSLTCTVSVVVHVWLCNVCFLYPSFPNRLIRNALIAHKHCRLAYKAGVCSSSVALVCRDHHSVSTWHSWKYRISVASIMT